MATFRSKIRSFRIGNFEFINGHLRLDDESELKTFRGLIEGMPKALQHNVVEITGESAQETPVQKSNVARGSATTNSLPDKTEPSQQEPAKAPVDLSAIESGGKTKAK